MNTKDKGNTTEAMVLAALVRAGRDVLVPWGDNLRYDLAYEDQDTLVRVQCKTGRFHNGTVAFSTSSNYAHRRNRGSKDYRGQADVFGVYCERLGTVYFVPVNICGRRECRLRVTPTKNSQNRFVRHAKEYEFILHGSSIGRAADC